MEKNSVLEIEAMNVLMEGDFGFDFGYDFNSDEAKTVQEEADQVWNRFYITDFSKTEDVVEFLAGLQPYTECGLAQLPVEHLVRVLKVNGYRAGAYTDDAFDGTNKEIFGRYLVGQAMSMLENPMWKGIPPLFQQHVEIYRSLHIQ